MSNHYDLIVIGGGPGGYVAAIKAAHLGCSVALVEQDLVGGTCLNRGCIPTKALLHTADLYAAVRQGADSGLAADGCRIDFPALRERVRTVCATVRGGVEGLLAANGVTVVAGRGTIVEPGRVAVALADGGAIELAAGDLIAAPGSSPAVPPIPGADLPGVFTSDSLLAHVPDLKRPVIVGGGVIGMEFAGFYQALGAEVTVVELMARVLPTMDRELGTSLAQLVKKRGGTIATGAAVERIERASDGSLLVRYRVKDEERTAPADGVLIATGRYANTEGLFGNGFALDLEHGRIPVDATMRTAVEHVYAIGDAADAGIQLAHAASAQGIVAASAIAGAPCDIDLGTIPACVYTSPEIASVGLTEAAAKEAGIPVRCGKFPMTGNAKTVIAGAERSFIKVVSGEDGRILGAHLMCNRATDLVGEFTQAIANNLTLDQMARAVRPHPTYNEAVTEAIETLLEGPIHALPKRR